VRSILTLLALVGIFAILAILALPILLPKPKPPALYVDLGNRRYETSGLGGRLIVRWEGSAKYQLYIDPLDQAQAASFQALAVNPPHPLSVMIQLIDSSGMVGCQKEILLPPTAQSSAAHAATARTTTTGDTVQNMTGSDGKIDEITISGPLPCSLDSYRHLTGWEFNSNFPAVAAQMALLRHADAEADSHSAHSATTWRPAPPAIQHLNAPIEGDDVIVGDNPTKGIVDTSSGRVFLVSAASWQTRSAEWQTFPAAVHFHCEKSGACVLTRTSSRTVLQAHLMK